MLTWMSDLDGTGVGRVEIGLGMSDGQDLIDQVL